MIPDILHTCKPEFLNALGIDATAFDNARIAVVTGDNAAGKSLLRKYISAICGDRDIAKMHFSQQARATAGFGRAFVYGSEDDEATGAISAGTLMGAIRNMRSWEKKHVAIFDEPEIGMSEEAQAGCAEYMYTELAKWPEKSLGAVVMTHSRYFAAALSKLPDFVFVNLGRKYKTVEEWISRKITPVSPEEIRERGLKNLRTISKILAK